MALSLGLVVVLLGLVFCVNAIPSGRILNGVDASVGQFPYQVSLKFKDGSHTCGGCILNENFILTAAHCVVVGAGVETYPAQYLEVRVGSIQRDAGGKLMQLKRVIVNRNYSNFLNDLALLELEEPLVWSDNIQPIEMADMEVPAGEYVTVSGWGGLYNGSPLPHRLQWTTLMVLSTAECGASINWGYDSIICLAHRQNYGVCNGDSGGPATYQGKLVGVSSFIINGCGSQYPDGYTKVSYHRDWIQENMTPLS